MEWVCNEDIEIGKMEESKTSNRLLHFSNTPSLWFTVFDHYSFEKDGKRKCLHTHYSYNIMSEINIFSKQKTKESSSILTSPIAQF